MAQRKPKKAMGAYVGHCPACLAGQMREVSEMAIAEKEKRESAQPLLAYSIEWAMLNARLRAVDETQGYVLCGFHAGTSKVRGKR